MIPDLSHIFASYEELRAEADAIFERVASQYPECVHCRPGCSDCCHALFDLSLVEAMYINNAFNKRFGHGPERSRLLERASEIDRDLTRIKRELFRAEKDGADAREIMTKAASLRMPCPLLNAENTCALYDCRPITCRLYGIPLDIGGQAKVCGLSAFEKGRNYPAVRVAKIHKRLEDMSAAIADTIKSRFELADVYVPLSMALLTRYDDAWLGIGDAPAEE